MSADARKSIGCVAVIGGTGQLGRALATRWAGAGIDIRIGSRDAAKAQQVARELTASTGMSVAGGSMLEAAEAAGIIVVAVPFAAQAETLAEIRPATTGKIVLDTTVPLMPPKVMRVQLPAEGSAAVRAQQLLGSETTVVSAFHNVSAAKLARAGAVDCDVLVCGDSPAARRVAIALVEAAGLRGLHAGALVNSAASEALTSVLILINKTYSVEGAGVRITGHLTAPED